MINSFPNGQSRTTCRGKPWSPVALLRKRAVDPHFGNFKSALLRSILSDASTTYELVHRVSQHAEPITKRLYLVGFNNTHVAEIKLANHSAPPRPRVLCQVPDDLAAGWPAYDSSYVWFPCPIWTPGVGYQSALMFALSKSMNRLAKMDLETGDCQYLTLSPNKRYVSLFWAKQAHTLVVVSGVPYTPSTSDPFRLVVFNAVPFRLVCVLNLDRSSIFKTVRYITVQEDLLIMEQRARRFTKPTLHCYHLSQFVQRYTINEPHIQELLACKDLFREELCNGLPETIRLTTWPEADFMIPGFSMGEIQFCDHSLPRVFLAQVQVRRPRQYAQVTDSNMQFLCSADTCAHARYVPPAAPLPSRTHLLGDNVAEGASALLVTGTRLMLHATATTVEVLQYEREASKAGCVIRSCYKITPRDMPDEERWELFWNVPKTTPSGDVVKVPLIPQEKWAESDENVVKGAACDLTDNILSICLLPEQAHLHGFGNLYDLRSGKLLKKVPLPRWRHECTHDLAFAGDCLVHTQWNRYGRTVDILILKGTAPKLMDEED